MLKEIKNWKSNFIKKSSELESNILHKKDDIFLKKYYSDNDNIHIYQVYGTLSEDPSYYLDYLWNPEKIKEINKNIIDKVELVNENENSKELYLLFKFKTKNISIEGFDKKEILYLEKKSNGYEIYGKILENKNSNYININEGYSFLEVKKVNNTTEINSFTQFKLEVPSLLELIPGILILKLINNLSKVINL